MSGGEVLCDQPWMAEPNGRFKGIVWWAPGAAPVRRRAHAECTASRARGGGISASRTRANSRSVGGGSCARLERHEHDEMYRRRSEWAAGIWASGTWANARPASLQVPLACERRTHDEMYGQRSERWRQVSFAHAGQCTARRGTVLSTFERRKTRRNVRPAERELPALRAHEPIHGRWVAGPARV
jgi:hypothetical protein